MLNAEGRGPKAGGPWAGKVRWLKSNADLLDRGAGAGYERGP
jgi:hypothetical protein